MRSCNQSKSIFDFQQHVQRLSNGLKAMFPTQCDLLLGKTMTANMADTCEQKLNFFCGKSINAAYCKILATGESTESRWFQCSINGKKMSVPEF